VSLEDAAKLLIQRGHPVDAKSAIGLLDRPTLREERKESEGEKSTKIEESSQRGVEIATTYPEDWTDEKIADFFTSVRRQSRDARAYKESIRDEVWDLYNNLQDFSQKADWQAKEVRPKVFMMVESVVGFIQLGLFKLRDWFDVIPINPTNPNNRIKAWIVKQILKFYATRPDFIYEILKAIKWGFLSELFIFKIWEGEETKYTVEPVFLSEKRRVDKSLDEKLPTIRQKILRRRKVMYAAGDPHMFYLDYSGKENFVIEEGKMQMNVYEKLVEDGLLEDHVDELVQDAGQTIQDVKKERRRENVNVPPSTYFKEFLYHEYWGDIVDEKGKIAFRNVHFIIGQEKYILLKPESITFFDGESPYVIAPCIYVPGSVYHKSLIEPVAGVAKMMSELFCLTLDALFATVLNVFEVDVDRVLNVDDISNGIGPNTVIQKTGPEKVLDVTQVGKVPGEVFAGLDFLTRILEEDTAITKGMIGVPQTGKRQTKGEVQQQTEFTVSFFQALIQNIENNFLARVLTKVWYRVLQFPNELSHPKLADLIGEQAASLLNKMTAEERYDVINGDYEIRVTGLSGLIAKREALNNILGFLRIAGRSPDMMAWVDMQKLLFEILDLLNIDPQTILLPKPRQPLNAKQPGMQPNQPGQPGRRVPTRPNGQGGNVNLEQIMRMMAMARANAGTTENPATIAEG